MVVFTFLPPLTQQTFPASIPSCFGALFVFLRGVTLFFVLLFRLSHLRLLNRKLFDLLLIRGLLSISFSTDDMTTQQS